MPEFRIEIMQRPHSLQEIRKIWVMIQKAIAVMVLLRQNRPMEILLQVWAKAFIIAIRL